MSETPRVSIIVPVYNLKQYLERCVDSLIHQTFRDYEIILVDDGSTDGSAALCDGYAKDHEEIKVVHKENGGLVSAWKRGVLESVGEYLCFVDGDDWVDVCMLKEMAAHTGKGKKEIIACDYQIEKPGEAVPVYQTLPPGSYNREELKKQVFPRLLGNENRTVCFSRCMKLISRSLIEDNCHFSEESIKMGEDVTVMLPALFDCDRLVILNRKTYYHYYYNPVSMVHKYDTQLADNIKNLKKIIDKVLKEKGQTGLYQSAEREYLFLLMLVVKNEAGGNPTGYRNNIRKLCKEQEEIRKLIEKVPLKVQEKANRLIYAVMKKPTTLRLWVLRLAMIVRRPWKKKNF